MKSKYRLAALLTALLLVLSVLSGCIAQDMRVSFGDDGKITCIVTNLIAQSYFEAAGTDARTHFKKEIESGKELISKTIGKETYYGLRTEPFEFDTIEEFCSAAELGVIDAFSVTAQNDGGYISATVTVDMPAKAEVEEAAESNGAAALANKAVKVLNVHFPQKVNSYAGSYSVTINNDQKDLEAVLYYFDEAYSFRVTGYLSSSYVVNASLKIGKPEEGWTPGGLMRNARLESYPRGSADLTGAEWHWYDVSGTSKTEIGTDEAFVPGRTYAVECTLRPSRGFMACEYTDCYIWDQSSRGVYIGGLEPDMIFITGRYKVPGEEPAVYQPTPVVFPDDETYTVMPEETGKIYDTTVTLDKIELEIDEPRIGVTYPDLKWKFKDPEGIDADKIRFKWFGKASGTTDVDWEEINGNYEFEVGSEFGFEMYIAFEKGYAVNEETKAFVNGKPADFGRNGSREEWVISFDFPPLKEPPVQLPSSRNIPFVDVRDSDYFREAVVWAFNAEPQITDGNGKDKFMPEQTCTRGQVVTFLWRAAGCPEPKTKKNPFGDVSENDYFYKPVLWAVEKGITEGTSPTAFSPAKTCTNAHILTFLYRAVGAGEDGWYEEAFSWADNSEIIKGSFNGTYDVKADCPRKNVVYYLHRFAFMDAE